jgi:hypothetical protein
MAMNPGEANQHGVIADVVVGEVVGIGVPCEQFGAIIEIHTKTSELGSAERFAP